MNHRLLLPACLLMFAGCSVTPETAPIRPPDEIYRDAYENMNVGNYLRAEDWLKRIMSRYPFTDFAVQAHLDILFVYLQMNNPVLLAEEADRFIRENPRHPEIDYVYYMKGLGYFRETPNLLEELADVDTALREIANAETSFQHFSQLVTRYPDSSYTADARLRMIELKNRIARHDIYIAEYYLRRSAWVSAIHRANRVLKDLQGTPAEIDALMVLERAYSELGLDELAETARRTLAANPGRQPVILEND